MLIASIGLATPVFGPMDESNSSPLPTERVPDFNADGFSDLAVGAPGWTSPDGLVTGAVLVFNGAPTGLRRQPDDVVTLSNLDLAGRDEEFSGFGSALTSGDFDGDGFADVAIAAPSAKVGANTEAGRVYVLYGSRGGLGKERKQAWSQDGSGMMGSSDPDDAFGEALAAATLDGDAFDDLVVGIPGESVNGVPYSGAVQVLHGSIRGLTGAGNLLLTQSPGALPGIAEEGDGLGSALSTCDFDGNGLDDLAIGAPADTAGNRRAGTITIVPQRPGGLHLSAAKRWSRASPGAEGSLQHAAYFGASLAAGDLGGGPECDLAVGVPGDTVGNDLTVGGVHLLFGSAGGLSTDGDRRVTQQSLGLQPEYGFFGLTLAAGDVTGDREDELTIGFTGKRVGGYDDAGAAVLGDVRNLRSGGRFQRLSQNAAGVEEQADPPSDGGDRERFSGALAMLDLNGDGRVDLVIGVPEENDEYNSTAYDGGGFHVLYGASNGVSTQTDVFIAPRPPVPSNARVGTAFAT